MLASGAEKERRGGASAGEMQPAINIIFGSYFFFIKIGWKFFIKFTALSSGPFSNCYLN
jgi:hypothetical protein